VTIPLIGVETAFNGGSNNIRCGTSSDDDVFGTDFGVGSTDNFGEMTEGATIGYYGVGVEVFALYSAADATTGSAIVILPYIRVPIQQTA